MQVDKFITKPFSKISQDNISYILVGYVVFSCIFLISPFVSYTGLSGSSMFMLAVIIVLYLMYYRNRLISKSLLMFSTFTICLALITGMYWGSLLIAAYPALFVSCLVSVSLANREELTLAVDISSKLLVIILIGAAIGFVYYLLGGVSLIVYETSWGRLIELYPFSFAYDVLTGAGSSYINVLRMAGIYDEPGSFSMVICLIAAMRHLLKMDRKLTWYLLIFGFLTFSLAHIIYTVIHWLSESQIRNKTKKLLIFLLVSTLIFAITGTSETVMRGLINRVVSFEGDTISIRVSNSRSKHVIKALIEVKERSTSQILLGPDGSCLTGGECKNGKIDFTPLSPILIQGLLLSWYYYIVLFMLIILGLSKQKYLVLFGVALLFMQRASMHSFGYSMLIAMIIIIALRVTSSSRKNILKNES
jgi:hypothetical protein